MPGPRAGARMPMRWFGGQRSAGALLGGIRMRLIGMILLVMVPLVAVQGFELYQDRERDIADARSRALQIARFGGEQYRSTILEVRTLLETIALVPEVAAGSAGTCAAFLRQAGQKLAWAAAFWVIEPDGRVACTTVPHGVGVDLSDRDYFRNAITTREFGVSDFYIGRLTGLPNSMAGVPALDAA